MSRKDFGFVIIHNELMRLREDESLPLEVRIRAVRLNVDLLEDIEIFERYPDFYNIAQAYRYYNKATMDLFDQI